jgi:mannose-6-phosphate isomerase class I
MGTYPELPSYILESGEDLQDVLDKNPDELIGKKTVNKFGHTKIPYLPKVLSIAKALPLQLHPVCIASPKHQIRLLMLHRIRSWLPNFTNAILTSSRTQITSQRLH